MKIAAVIAEYNPFHNGHLYQLNTIRKELGADRILVVMSGNFMQRGIPAITDKYIRSRMALDHGADLVLELPAYYSLGSAEYFAQGAVALLDKLGIVDILHFGSESGEITQLKKVASVLAEESDSYAKALKNYQKEGLSYPLARSKALSQELAYSDSGILVDLVSQPNNTLGIEYIKALLQRQSTIEPITLKRKGSGYHDMQLIPEKIASASAIRQLLSETPDTLTVLQEHMPESAYYHLINSSHQEFLFADDFSSVLYYKLLQEFSSGKVLTGYYDITEQISDTFRKNLSGYTNFSEFCLACKTKNITYSRISRCLMHLVLNQKQEIIEELKANDYIFYAHLLGFNENGKDILRLIKAHSSIPVISKLPDALKKLNGIALTSLEADIYATQLYFGIQGQKYHHAPSNEFTLKFL